ncbi:hypothetical protein OFO12_06000, partial [Campylobacter sp. JMF_04 NA10]
MKALNQSRGSIVLAAVLFAVSGVNIANADKIIGTNDASPYVGTKSPSGSQVTISNACPAGETCYDYVNGEVFGGRNDNVDADVTNNTINITKANIKGSKYIRAGQSTKANYNAMENTIEITDSTITINSSTPYIIGGEVRGAGSTAKNNTVIVKNSDINYYIYGGKGGTSSDNDSTIYNNHVYIENSKFGGVWGGQAQAPSDKANHAKYNTLIIVGGGYSQNAKSDNLRGGTTYGAGDSEYNTLSISGGTKLNFNTVSIFGGYSQGNAKGNNRYNQLILDNVTIPNASNTIYAGGIKANTSTLSSSEAVGNRAYINDLKFAKGIVVGGSSELGNTSDNIVVINGTTELKSAYSGEVKEGADGTAKDNLVIMSGGTINENIYGGYTQGGETSGNAVYFMGGEVSGIVGGGNNGNKNTLILGDSTSTWGTRKAGQISNFENLNFNVLQEGDKSKAVLSLTGANSSNLKDASVKFLDPSNGDSKKATITVGGNGGVGVNSLRDSGGGANGIKALSETIKYTPYTAKDSTAIKVVTLVTQKDEDEILQRTLSNGTKEKQATYNIGTTYTFAYKDLDLTKKETKFYLIDSTSELADYTKMANYNTNIGASGTTVKHDWDNSEGIVIDAYQTNQDYIIDNASTFTRNIRGMFVSADKKSLYIAGNHDITEEIKDTIGGDDFFTKFGQDKSGNTITISPKGDLDLSNVTLDGGPSGNTLNVGKDRDNPIKMGQIKVKDVKNFSNINFYLPENPADDSTAITLTDGSNTDLSKSDVRVYSNSLRNIEDNGGRVHLLKSEKGKIKNPKANSMKLQIGASLEIDMPDGSLDLYAKPTPVIVNDQTKIFNEARIAGMAAVWEGSYLISNHLERIIPDGYTELFPYAIFEGYDKRYNTGSHVDSLGFNANAGLAGKAPNSKGEFTMGIFIEYGNVDYDAYLDDGTKGSGDAYYAGVGAFGKQENASGSYYEGSFRVGQLTTNFDGTLNFN